MLQQVGRINPISFIIVVVSNKPWNVTILKQECIPPPITGTISPFGTMFPQKEHGTRQAVTSYPHTVDTMTDKCKKHYLPVISSNLDQQVTRCRLCTDLEVIQLHCGPQPITTTTVSPDSGSEITLNYQQCISF